MALEYRLTLAGTTPLEEVAARALPNVEERPIGTPPLLSANLFERYGFLLTVNAGRDGYFDAESEDGRWEWKPEAYVAVGFRMDKFGEFQWEVINMLTVVRRVLDTGPEDAAFAFNGDVLLLARFDGVLVKHRQAWWHSYPGADQVISDRHPPPVRP
jgi:hypothetical protein